MKETVTITVKPEDEQNIHLIEKLISEQLKKQGEAGIFSKTYYGLVSPSPASVGKPEKGLIEFPIKRAEDSIMLRVIGPDGLPASTYYETVCEYPESHPVWGGMALLRFNLLTGRTHQIRVHCLASGFPLVGDTLYDGMPAPQLKLEGQALWAGKMEFVHPVTGAHMKIEATPPSWLDAALL